MKVKARDKQIRVFGIGLPLLLMLFAWRHFHRVGADGFVVLLAVLAVISIVLFVFFRAAFERFFDIWMKVTGAIGWVVTTVVLALMYFVVFTPISVILRLRGKDFMAGTWSQEASYWIPCEEQADAKERYINQF